MLTNKHNLSKINNLKKTYIYIYTQRQIEQYSPLFGWIDSRTPCARTWGYKYIDIYIYIRFNMCIHTQTNRQIEKQTEKQSTHIGVYLYIHADIQT